MQVLNFNPLIISYHQDMMQSNQRGGVFANTNHIFRFVKFKRIVQLMTKMFSDQSTSILLRIEIRKIESRKRLLIQSGSNLLISDSSLVRRERMVHNCYESTFTYIAFCILNVCSDRFSVEDKWIILAGSRSGFYDYDRISQRIPILLISLEIVVDTFVSKFVSPSCVSMIYFCMEIVFIRLFIADFIPSRRIKQGVNLS